MKKRLFLAAAILCAHTVFAVPVTPIVQPHVTFVTGAGLPCAGCKLYTYAAGTTTPLATYTDASGVSQNTNPIILDAAGGGNIWLGASSYKFILKDSLGSTIWSVDQVNAAALSPCGPAGAVQIANSAVNGLACDSAITINTTNHTISVGTLPANHVTIGALGTPTSWNFDTTSPDTARASLATGQVGAGTINQIAVYPATGAGVQGASAIPVGVTAITQSPDDNSANPATTAYVALPGAINPTSVKVAAGVAMTANQGNGIKVQHSTGTVVAGNSATFDANGNVIDSGSPLPSTITGTFTVTSVAVLSNTCHTEVATMSAAVPAGHAVVVSVAQGSSTTGELAPTISNISGASVSVAFCNSWSGTVTLVAGTLNLAVL